MIICIFQYLPNKANSSHKPRKILFGNENPFPFKPSTVAWVMILKRNINFPCLKSLFCSNLQNNGAGMWHLMLLGRFFSPIWLKIVRNLVFDFPHLYE